jgi:hypothetical protein
VAAGELEDVLDAGLPHNWNHRLGLVRGQRAKPRALPTGHDDGLHAGFLTAAAT